MALAAGSGHPHQLRIAKMHFILYITSRRWLNAKNQVSVVVIHES
jgi:hypothetical protein